MERQSRADDDTFEYVISYLESSDISKLFALLFPDAIYTQLPEFYVNPSGYLEGYYYNVARFKEIWEGGKPEEYEREMLPVVQRQSARLVGAVAHLQKNPTDTTSLWIHWIRQCRAATASQPGTRDVYEESIIKRIKKILAGKQALNLQERRGYAHIVTHPLVIAQATTIQCSICATVDVSHMCSKCNSYVCSKMCMKSHVAGECAYYK